MSALDGGATPAHSLAGSVHGVPTIVPCCTAIRSRGRQPWLAASQAGFHARRPGISAIRSKMLGSWANWARGCKYLESWNEETLVWARLVFDLVDLSSDVAGLWRKVSYELACLMLVGLSSSNSLQQRERAYIECLDLSQNSCYRWHIASKPLLHSRRSGYLSNFKGTGSLV